MEKTDTAGITLTLASLATTVDSLPLKQESAAAEEASSQGIDPELTGMDRAMASLRNAVDGIVSVRRTDESIEPLMAPEARYFIRANLALQLQAARLALLRGEETVFRQSLQDVNQWLGEYYDADSAAVQSARREITEMRDSVIAVAAPDISRSLRLLRQFNALNDAAASGGSSDATAATTEPEATPEPEPEPDPEPDTEPEQQ
jgi:uroporphyrin-3 C-methyltransferase